jgi:hypothetical protein
MHACREERRGVVGRTDASSQAPRSSPCMGSGHARPVPAAARVAGSLVPEPLVRCPRQSINNTKRVGGRDVGKAELARTTREWITARAAGSLLVAR